MDPDRPSGAPVGRRLFLGLLGAGVAGLALTKWSYGSDDVTSATVAESVPLGSMRVEEGEGSVGQHPNLVTSERFRYYSVGDVPAFNERSWRLAVDGAGAANPLSLRYRDVKAFPYAGIKADFRCVTGWRVRDNIWRGVRLRDVIDAAAPNDQARFVTFYANDGVYTESLSMAQARSNNALLVWELDGRPLADYQGYPLRLIYPDMYGYKNIKWVTRLELKPQRDLGFWEQLGWEVDGYVYNPPST